MSLTVKFFAAVAAALTLTACGGATNGVDGAAAPTVTSSPEASATEELADEPDMGDETGPAVDNQTLIDSVTIKSCKIGEYGVEVEGSVKNPKQEISDLIATIEITDPAGDRLDEAGVIETAIKPGQKAKFTASGLESDVKGKIACSVLSVDWYPTS